MYVCRVICWFSCRADDFYVDVDSCGCHEKFDGISCVLDESLAIPVTIE